MSSRSDQPEILASALIQALDISGNFGEVCPGPQGFRDLMVTIDNRGSCPLLVSNITSSSPEFQVPSVVALPRSVAPGANIEIPIRCEAASAGAKAATGGGDDDAIDAEFEVKE